MKKTKYLTVLNLLEGLKLVSCRSFHCELNELYVSVVLPLWLHAAIKHIR